MKYFEYCQSVEEASDQRSAKHYRELLTQYHPDHAGEEGEAATKEIIRTLVHMRLLRDRVRRTEQGRNSLPFRIGAGKRKPPERIR